MGVIIRQSIKNAFITYLSIGLGALNMLVLFPLAFTQSELGIFQFVVSNAQAFFPFVLLGAGSLVVRFFPDFKDERSGHNGFLFLLLSIGFSGFAVFFVLALVSGNWILSYYGDKSILFTQYLQYILPLVLFAGVEFILGAHSSNFGRIAVPTFFTSFLLKLLMGVQALLCYFGVIDFFWFMTSLLAIHLVVILGLALYLHSLGQLRLRPDFRLFRGPLRKSMITYAFYGTLGSVGSYMAVQIDVFMVGTLLDLKNTGIFSIAMFMALVLDVPRRSIENISAPIIARAWKEDDRPEISSIYKKSALNQLLAGCFIFVCIWSCIDEVFELMPNGAAYAPGKYVVLILGLGRLIDLATGVNHSIISFSKYFRFNFYVIILLAALNIGNNLIFIPLFGINGAALATAFSLGIYNLLKLWFIRYKFQMHPFSTGILTTLLTAVISYTLVFWLPDSPSPLLDILIKAGIISGVFLFMLVRFKLSPEAYRLLQNLWRKRY
jgi:O-antigen/teichoic acid export membrane protein